MIRMQSQWSPRSVNVPSVQSSSLNKLLGIVKGGGDMEVDGPSDIEVDPAQGGEVCLRHQESQRRSQPTACL